MRGGISPLLHATPTGDGSNERLVQRDIFPLPFVLEDEAGCRSSLSRGCRQRVAKRLWFQKEVNRCIGSLNQLYDFSLPGRRAQQVGDQLLPNLAQVRSLEFIEECIGDLGPSDSMSGAEALMALRIVQGYEELPTTSALGSFVPDKVSLPSAEVQPVQLSAAMGPDGQIMMEDFIYDQVLSEDDARSKLEASGIERCYTDPKLRSQVAFEEYVDRLHGLGLVDFSIEKAVEETGIFFVKKKGDRLRMILDCRRSNCWFKEPKGVKLTTGESLSKIRVKEDQQLYVCSADLANAFYTLSTPLPLRKFFGLKRVRAAAVGVQEIGGVRVSPDQWITPRIAVLPMGWTWALYWCQKLHEAAAERSGLSVGERLQDFHPPPTDGFYHVQYVDNLHVFGVRQEEVRSRFWAAVEELRSIGLTVHEEEDCLESTKVLGWEYESKATFRPGRTRVWRVRKAIRGKASGQQLERVIGHATFISLGKREALSVFAEVYTFIKRHYKQEVELWKSVRRELSIWDGISPLITQDLSAPWCEKLQAVDASEWGLGVCETDAAQVEVEQLSRFSERWRFRGPESSGARASIIAAHSTVCCGSAAFSFSRGMKDSDFSAPSPGGLNLDEEDEVSLVLPQPNSFVGVGFSTVARPWRVVGRYKWKKRESMPVFEARSTLHAVKHALRRVGSQRMRHIVLTDSMTAALAFTKGRTKGQKLRNVVQKVASLSLATGSTFFPRWIPSEWNPADGPSRGGHAPSEPQQLLGDALPRFENSWASTTTEEEVASSFGATARAEVVKKKEESEINTKGQRGAKQAKARGKPASGFLIGARDIDQLLGSLAEISVMGQKEENEGPGLGGLSGPPLAGGRGSLIGKLCEGKHSVPPTRVERKRVPEQIQHHHRAECPSPTRL